MMLQIFEKKTRIPASAAQVFAWHERPQALRQLIPPDAPIRVISHTGGIRDGALVVLRIGYGIASVTWRARHEGYRPGVSFTDVQERGPFAYWRHTHLFHPEGESACVLHDHIEYALPCGAPARWVASRLVRSQLEKTFQYRHHITFQAFC